MMLKMMPNCWPDVRQSHPEGQAPCPCERGASGPVGDSTCRETSILRVPLSSCRPFSLETRLAQGLRLLVGGIAARLCFVEWDIDTKSCAERRNGMGESRRGMSACVKGLSSAGVVARTDPLVVER
jgi:hypothetical protein